MGIWTAFKTLAAALLLVAMILKPVVEAQLQYGYYETLGCRGVENLVRTSVGLSFLTDPTASAAMLRLAFHDCQVGPVRTSKLDSAMALDQSLCLCSSGGP